MKELLVTDPLNVYEVQVLEGSLQVRA